MEMFGYTIYCCCLVESCIVDAKPKEKDGRKELLLLLDRPNSSSGGGLPFLASSSSLFSLI
jgi:hypothetical protein